LLLCVQTTFAQPIFTKVADQTNPIVADAGVNAYLGASWIDYDNDLDLFVNNSRLYRNDGNGQFTKLITRIGLGLPVDANVNFGYGNSWADIDNDGELGAF
jgi:FG-GAP-like repeat